MLHDYCPRYLSQYSTLIIGLTMQKPSDIFCINKYIDIYIYKENKYNEDQF